MTVETILPIPDIFAAKRILCIQPHYDDNDIAAAGILTQLAQNGAEIFYLTATDDLMGVVDTTLSDKEAADLLKSDQFAAGKIVGVKEQFWCGYPDAGEYNYFDLRRDFLKYIRMLKPDFVFAPDAWLTYEGHHDHIQTGLAAAEAVMFAGLTKIASSDPDVDAATRSMTFKASRCTSRASQTTSQIFQPHGKIRSAPCAVTKRSSTPRVWIVSSWHWI